MGSVNTSLQRELVQLCRLAESVELVAGRCPRLLMQSRKHCHSRDVSSVVIDQNLSGGLQRAFLAWGTHQLWTNRPFDNGKPFPFAVGVHDHRYDLAITGVSGRPFNERWELGRSPSNVLWSAWRCERSGIEPGGAEFNYVGSVYMRHIDSEQIVPNRMLHLLCWQPHTIYVPVNESAAWMVDEGKQLRTTTTLYTELREIKTDGLYVPFESVGEVVAHVQEFVEIAIAEAKVKHGESIA